MSIRAKFRVLQINQYFQSQPATQGVQLRPVMAKCASYPDASEENAYFWDATPSGEARVSTELGGGEFEGGACYYIDMEPDPEGAWQLEHVHLTKGNCGIKLALEWRSAVEMDIGNAAAWAAFVEAGPGSKWRVTFSKAPETGAGEPY